MTHDPAPPNAVNELADRFWEAILDLNPTTATVYGDDRYDDRLEDPSPAGRAKARHLMPYRANRIIFAGDGHSDLDAALAADVVFAKCALANELDARGVAFYPFDTLEPVLAFLETVEDALREPAAWAAGLDEGR